MNNVDYKDIIKSNYHGEDGTFLGELHESAIFEKQLYDELCEAIKRYTEETKENIYKIDREYSWYITLIYSYFLIKCACHFDPANGYKIKNDVTNEFLTDKMMELLAIVEEYFVGNADIPNP